ncbi:PsbP domain-containing protein 2, chloroplastic [Porphyridium purpureum]|uniref:PsbP domain-containing protein 2, chloroplastic n=1 Tax=Porphyridium purpureum TaxID=35688 RepID=A0A5J4Z337_PORPP|nr:PsbP domain-containing protein 2, chloroplastic [Porphyridium purpureum]|eukprot:POR4402..scf295_1
MVKAACSHMNFNRIAVKVISSAVELLWRESLSFTMEPKSGSAFVAPATYGLRHHSHCSVRHVCSSVGVNMQVDGNSNPTRATKEASRDRDVGGMALVSRRLMLKALVAGMAMPALQAAVLPNERVLAGEEPDQDGSGTALYKGPISLGYVFEYPVGWTATKKVIKTHLSEIQVISKTDSKLYAGLVVDPVKINSVKEFGTPEALGEKVIELERRKDGVSSATLLSSSQKNAGDLDYYYIEYEVASSRGHKRFLAVATITGKQLYVLTAQCVADAFAQNERTMRAIVDSLRVKRQYFDAVHP